MRELLVEAEKAAERESHSADVESEVTERIANNEG
jgi:hypothetical protein